MGLSQSQIVSGIGPNTSSKSHYNGINSAPKYQIAFDNFGIQILGVASTPYYSWIFTAPPNSTEISVTLWVDGTWTPSGTLTGQLYGGWTHNVNNNPANAARDWVSIGTTATLNGSTLNVALATSVANTYPAYIISIENSATDKGVVNWICSAS